MNQRRLALGLVAGAVGAALALVLTVAVAPAAATADGPVACQEVIVNGGFENGHTGWTEYSKLGSELLDPFYPHSGAIGAWLGASNSAEDSLTQTVALPAGPGPIELTFWWAVLSEEAAGHSFDVARAEILRADGVALTTTLTIDNDSADDWVWNEATADLSPYAGQTVQFRLAARNDATNPSSFFFDDVRIAACAQTGTPTPTATAPVRRNPIFLPVILR